jgi:molecular chaperone DnaK
MQSVVGIDVGTSNTCAAILDNGLPTLIPSRSGYPSIPSVVAISRTGTHLVGRVAKRQAVMNPEHTVHGAKRLIGRLWGSQAVHQVRQSCPYLIVKGRRGDVRVQLREQVYSVEELCAFILAEIKSAAEEHCGRSIEQAVLTVPAYFNDSQRHATGEAARIAGFEVLRIIDEPTAAALAFDLGRHVEGDVVVYDLGGGTFDVSVLHIEGGTCEIVATSGDSLLGGEDFDERIVTWMLAQLERRSGLDAAGDPEVLQRSREAAEQARRDLSTARRTDIRLPFLWGEGVGSRHFERSFSRIQLEALTEDLVERTIEKCRGTLLEAGLDRDRINEVVLVGGVTRMPLVQRRVAEFFGRAPCKGVHPDEVVALGAAIAAGRSTASARRRRPRRGGPTAARDVLPGESASPVDRCRDFMARCREAEALERERRSVEQLVGEVSRLLPELEELLASTGFGRRILATTLAQLRRAKVELRCEDPQGLDELRRGLDRSCLVLRRVGRRVGLVAAGEGGDGSVRAFLGNDA